MQSVVNYWLSDKELETISSGSYWNLEEEEKKKKQWNIFDAGMEPMLEFLDKERKYFNEYESILNFVEKNNIKIAGEGIDLAAGTCWATALLSKIEAVERIYALDISKHRLLKTAPIVFNHFAAKEEKIIRVVGDFLNIKLLDNSLDFCFMSSAFHHADDPNRLLVEIRRVLKPDGLVIMMGEKPIFWFTLMKQFLKNIVKMIVPINYRGKPVYKLFPRFSELYAPDPKDGEHYYYIYDYNKIFSKNGFRLFVNKQRDFTNFAAIKNRTI